ncbi:unnamed protein product [Paramecium pentaurelia]|uniref:WD40-repeat-containing domain n=1 Tax=Paramecium pentaurelia TaxID=43138 RepID=A0A8S1WWK3_9CILI|nr:unnamed protein product [Paramecium pentaurelia]
MLSIQSSGSSIIQKTMSKIEEHFLEVGNEIETGFSRIDELIDSLLHIPFTCKTNYTESHLEIPQINQFNISEFNYSSSIVESVTPLVKQIIKEEIEIVKQNLTQINIQQKIFYEKEKMNQQKNIVKEVIDSQEFKIIQSNTISIEGEQEINMQQQKQLMNEQQVEFKLIDEPNQQTSPCYAIVFDKNGSIMISTCSKEIKIWNFDQGIFSLTTSYQKHTDAVNCLVYSKHNNYFISGSRDKTIICWQQISQKEWICSQPYQKHDKWVNCLMLNKQEDQLISGGGDKKLIVWQVNFMKNELTFLYSLDKHGNSVSSFSFNQSESLMASCGYQEFIIWEKGIEDIWELKFNSGLLGPSGYKIHFTNNQQLFFVPRDKYINDLLVFEMQNGVFKLNSNKTITLIRNHECEDESNFPIIHNKDRNIILVRHKHDIYLIKELNDGTFQIIKSLKCQSENSNGTMTNNGQYFVFWDDKKKKYQSYEIIYK